jgi:hypothetical protein
MHRRASIVVWITAVVVIALAAQSQAGDGVTGRKVTVARGKFAHHTWSLAVKGRHHLRWYYLTLNGPSASGSSATRRSDRRRPPLWSRLMGDADGDGAIELDVTRNRVRSMRLEIGHPKSNRPDEWIHVKTRRITRHQAHEASVRRNFRFAVLHSRGNLCVKRVILFNRDGDRIDEMRVPCEF